MSCSNAVYIGWVSCPRIIKSKDIDRVNTYSWGSAVLAYLYRELCNTSMESKSDLCGPLQILQIWVWSRITLLTPDRVQQSHLASEQVADVLQGLPFPPYGAKWKRGFSWVHTVRHSVRVMRDMLDRMVDGQFKWTVYDMESPELSMYLEGDRNLLCRSACPLINFDIIEMHRPERCLRQFGMRQGIPPPAPNYDIFHKLTRQGRPNYDWDAFHKQFVDMWTNRYNFVMGGEFVIPGTPDTTLEYISWYRRISHIFVSPTLVPTTMVGYHPIDGRYRQSFEQQYQQQGHVSMSQHPTWTQNEGEAGTSTTNHPRYTQHYGDPRPSTTNTTFYTPPMMSSFRGYDHNFHTPYAGIFTQLLQSDFRPFMHDIRPRLNISPIPFQEYSDIPITEMSVSTVGPGTTPEQPRTEGDEEERYGRGRRTIVRPSCGTGGHRYHRH
ncbi:serine/threonine-protein phosphatase 7 long form homolog [Henckelia pumila]|uniref:serine/threonine-protein phosphatase 7 long form homolog n=1 Tax=Henckelia pumila TaxID=405737 RepID=UPI003C6DEF2E